MLEIIQELRQQTGYKFFFNHNELKKVKDVSVKFVDEELEQVLDALLGKVNLSYRIEQGVIIIVPGKVKNEEKEYTRYSRYRNSERVYDRRNVGFRRRGV